MFDIGWGEMFLIGIVALIVVGPKDLPALFRTVGNVMGKARGMAREFQRSMEQAANESGMSEVSESLRRIDRSLDSVHGSARKFAQTMTVGGGGFAGAGAVAASEEPKAEAPKVEVAAGDAVAGNAVAGNAAAGEGGPEGPAGR